MNPFLHLSDRFLGSLVDNDAFQEFLSAQGDVSGDLLRTEREVLACLAETEMGVGIWLSPSRTNELIDALSTRAQVFVKENFGKDFKDIQNHSDRLEALRILGFGIPRISIEQRRRRTGNFAVICQKPLKQLKDYQISVANDVWAGLQAPFARVLMQMPTGAGKTRTALEVVMRKLNEGGSVVWTADKTELLDQAVESFIEVAQHTAQKELRVIRDIEAWSENEKGGCFIVESVQSLYSSVEKREKIKALVTDGVIVFDECHSAIARTYREVLDDVAGRDFRLLGLSATPGRSTTEESEELAEFFLRKIVQLHDRRVGGVRIDRPIEFLQKQGVLSSVRYKSIELEYSDDFSDEEWGAVRRGEDLPKALVQRLCQHRQRNEWVVNEVERLAKLGRKVIVFTGTVSQSKVLTAAMLVRDVRALHIDGETSNRDVGVNLFRAGEVDVLLNCDLFSAGLDVPDIGAVVIARPTSSIVRYSQMIGRGLRGPAMGGTLNCDIVTVLDNLAGMLTAADIAMAFDEYFSSTA